MAIYRQCTSAMALCAVLCAFSLPALAQNEGFESGDFSSWSTIGNAAVVTTTNTATGSTVSAAEGSKFALITAGSARAGAIEEFLDLSNGSLSNIFTRRGSAIKRTIVANAGDTVSFSYNFLGFDFFPFNDYGFVSLSPVSGPRILGSIISVGNFGNSGWKQYSYTFADAGTYTLGVGVFNILDNSQPFSSKIAIDSVTVTPEPGEYAFAAFAGASVLGLVARARRRGKSGTASSA
ncbi:MAG: hypothetical protein H8F28_09005 [Fibrella sp.]|nr:hypothetical protein [Armatimonadota bacterium]